MGRLRSLLADGAVRQRVLAPFGFDAAILATNLATGIVIARALGPAGRGEIAATLLIVQIAAWLFSMGSTAAIAYRQSREPEAGGRLLGSWLALLLPIGVIAFVIGEEVLPTLFAAQTDAAIDTARIYLLMIVPVVLQAAINGVLLGDQDFLFYNLGRFLAPALIAVAYLVMWPLDLLSVEGALIVNAAATLAAIALCGARAVRRTGIEWPDPKLLRETLSYGLRAHGGSVAGFVNARLDLLIIPAFLGATSVGLYSIATNVTGIISSLSGTIAVLVLPVAARRDTTSARTVIRTLHVTLLIGVAIALPLLLLAEVALELVYGEPFGDAATALRILLPGEVLDASSVVLWSGLLAANRPFLSSVAAAPAAVLTVVGLLLFLESGGIEAAATVTTCAHVVVFVLSVLLYRRVARLRWRDFLRPPGAAPAPPA